MTFSNLYYLIDTACNEHCSKCHHWKLKSNRNVNIDKLIAFVNNASPDEFCIVGGEPLIYARDIKTIIQNIKGETRTVIVTNGILAKKDFIDFVKNYNVHLVFSIDTFDRNKWKFIRGNDTMDIVLENLEYSKKILSPYQISIQSVIAKETEQDVKMVDEYCHKNNIYHSIQQYVAEGFEGEWTPLSKQNHNSEISGECGAAEKNLSIMNDGFIYTCFQQNLIPDCQNPLGNVNTDTFSKIVSSNYLKFVTQKMKTCSFPCRVLKCNQGENK